MKRLLIKICSYLFNSKQTGWKEVMQHDAAMLLLFFAITQMGSIALLVCMLLDIGPRQDDEIIEEVLYFVFAFTPLITLVYGCVLFLRLRDYWLNPKKLPNKCDETQKKRVGILFPNFWEGILNRVNNFRWWEYYLYLPISLPVLAFAGACLFPTLAVLCVFLVILAYSYLAYARMFVPDMEMVVRSGRAFLIYTTGMYVVMTLGFIEEYVKTRLRSSDCGPNRKDSDATT